MSTDNLQARIDKLIIEQVGFKHILKLGGIKSTQALVADIGMDSLDVVELVMAVEDEFRIAIPDDDAQLVMTVQNLYDVTARYKALELA